MTVFIVMKNGVVDEVFDNWAAAKAHRDNLLHKWNIAEIVERKVLSI